MTDTKIIWKRENSSEPKPYDITSYISWERIARLIQAADCSNTELVAEIEAGKSGVIVRFEDAERNK